MIRKILIIFSLIISAGVAKAEHNTIEIDLNLIKVGVATHPGNYTNLVNRFVSGDTTLMPHELATVYYGYAFTSDYDPTDRYPEIEKAYLNGDYETTWALVSQALAYNPASLDLTIKGLVAANNIDNAEARKMIPVLQNRYGMISDIILMSGTGISNDSPFIVVCDDDLQRIIRNVIGAESFIGRSSIKDVEAIKIQLPDDDRQHILYFNNNLQKRYEREHMDD